MSDRVVVITGAFGALGRVVSTAFAAQGDKVVRVDFAPSAPEENASGLDLPGVDLTKDEAPAQIVEQVLAKFGRLDVLVNIAGGFAWETLRDGGMATWQRMFAMNVLTSASMAKAALPALEKAPLAHIVNIGAGAAVKADAGMGAYAASKAGVHRLTEALAAELAGTTVTVNAILPSIIDTPTNRADMPDADTSTWVKAEAIADIVQFLTSPAARAISGALIPVTRGSAH